MAVNKQILTGVGMLILLFLTPVVSDVSTSISANETGATATIVDFLPTLWVLAVLAFAALNLFKGSSR